jgi:molybdate transport system regulatory protein
MPNPVVRFRIDFAENANVGPGKIALLEAIRSSGSLSQAARELRMSYRRAWLLMASLNAAFKAPVTRATTGGKGGGGAALTSFGEQLIESYRALDRDITALAVRRLTPIMPAVAARRATRSGAPRRSVAAATRNNKQR